MQKIKIDNAPNWYEYLFVMLVLLSGVAFLSRYVILLMLVGVVMNLLLYSKNATIILTRTSFEIQFKAGFVRYSKVHRHFSRVVAEQTSIRFYDHDDNIVLVLDIGIAPDENEVHAITLRYDRKDSTIANKKNSLQIFQQIKQFYQG